MSYYSSSDQYDDRFDRRRRPRPPFQEKVERVEIRRPRPRSRKRDQKQALPPQETINQIWSKFSASKFSKATVILPPANEWAPGTSKPEPTPPSERTNILVSEDFEKTAQECRMRVRKLVEECKRVNMRYRDPEFDVECDLEFGRGHCLNGLGNKDFKLNQLVLGSTVPTVPKSVKRVHRIFEKPTFMKEVSPVDVNQGRLDNCWFMASLTALASLKGGIQRLCVEYDTKIGIYGFVFHRDGEWVISIIDDKLHLKSPDWDSPSVQRRLLEQSGPEEPEKEYRKTYQTGSQALFFAHCRNQNETWLPLLEKAYAKAHGDYSALNGGWIGEGIEDLTGGVTTELLTSDILDEDELWENEILKVNKEFLFGCSTGLMREQYGDRDGILEGHAYVIMEARQLSTGQRLVKLRNPWGRGKKGNWEGPWSDGSKEFTPESQQELGHKFADDSVFWISYEDMLRKYQHLDRTRLFVDDPDWRITQDWIAVDVSWQARFEKTFKIVLKKESPVVLVLSQLDDRYFEALRGQYTFGLQFRLHSNDSSGDEDYIVHSHKNCLMERSVVVELKSLPAGTYFIFVMVTAERDLKHLTVEEVIKEECRQKTDNEKLAQVGKAYDLAHGKVAAYMESKAKARDARYKAKARETAIAARRKFWERGHLMRKAVRKQNRKNRDKFEQKEAKRAEAQGKETKQPRDKAAWNDVRNVRYDKLDKAVQTGDPAPRPNMRGPLPALDSQVSMVSRETSFQTEGTVASPSSESQGMPGTPESSGVPLYPGPPLLRGFSTYSAPGAGPGPGPGQGPIRLPIQGPPPPAHFDRRFPQRRPTGPPQGFQPFPPDHHYLVSDGESSASPVSDFDDACSFHELSVEPRPLENDGQRRNEVKPRGDEGDFEDGPDPWNAICIVGLRVYSKDEELEVNINGLDDNKTEKKLSDTAEEGTDGDVEDEGEEVAMKARKQATKGVTAATPEGAAQVKDDDKEIENRETNDVPAKATAKASRELT